MPRSSLKIDIRRGAIMDRLRRDGRVLVSELARELNATQATIRNDLTALENDGQLVRMQGGALMLMRGGAQSPVLKAAAERCTAEKRRIAACCASMIHDGDTLMLNSGTTTLAVARALTAHKALHILTNSIAIATELGAVPTFQVMLLGGEINAQYGFIYGSDALLQLERYRSDWAILSVDSMSAAGGVTTYHPDEAVVDLSMLNRAGRTLVTADHTKIGRSGFARFHDVDKSLTLITDAESDGAQLKEMEAHGLEIILA